MYEWLPCFTAEKVADLQHCLSGPHRSPGRSAADPSVAPRDAFEKRQIKSSRFPKAACCSCCERIATNARRGCPAQNKPIEGGPTGVACVAERRSVVRSHTLARRTRRHVARQGADSLGRDVNSRSRTVGAALAGRGPRDWLGATIPIANVSYRAAASVQVEQDPPPRPQEHARGLR